MFKKCENVVLERVHFGEVNYEFANGILRYFTGNILDLIIVGRFLMVRLIFSSLAALWAI